MFPKARRVLDRGELRNAMRKFTATCCLVVALVSTNLWLLQVCKPLPETPAADCCRDGFCPRGAHMESPQDSGDDSCVCSLSPRDRQPMTVLLSSPAILPQDSIPPVLSTAGVVEPASFHLVSSDEVTPAPPPKA